MPVLPSPTHEVDLKMVLLAQLRIVVLSLWIAHAFRTLRRDNPDNDAFVQACRRWYLDNRTNLVVNTDYGLNCGWPCGKVSAGGSNRPIMGGLD